MSRETVSFEIQEPVARETKDAILVQIDGPDDMDPVWIPKSQIHDDSEVYRLGDTGTLVITEWIAKQKGLV